MNQPNRTLYRVSVCVRGKWEARTRAKADRPTDSEARQIGHNVNGMRNRNEPPVVDAVKIVRVEEYDEEVIEL